MACFQPLKSATLTSKLILLQSVEVLVILLCTVITTRDSLVTQLLVQILMYFCFIYLNVIIIIIIIIICIFMFAYD